MRTGDLSLVAGTRLKREDYKVTKHDAVFSKWQVLIGHSDWEDHSNDKEGVARYRVHNLPITSSPGLYELGLVVTLSNANQSEPDGARLGRGGAEKLDQDGILVVYLGQADCVRTRLQRYGRSGAHLRNVDFPSSDVSDLSDSDNESPEKNSDAIGLFEQTFSRGGSIVFRWAPMRSKTDAEETEAQLLQTFDYAWNKGSNGERRIDESLVKLTKMSMKANWRSGISRIFLSFSQKQVGITIEGDKKVLVEEKRSNDCDAAGENQNFLSSIFKLSRTRPQMVSPDECSVNSDSDPRCGFVMRGGVSCTRTPVKGRKRCKEHKGMRVYGLISNPSKENCVPTVDNSSESEIKCGVLLNKDESCRKKPVSGRKRCEEHKGMKINTLVSRLSVKKKPAEPETVEKVEFDSDLSKDKQDMQEQDVLRCCEATTKSGAACKRKPAKGSRRCWQHRDEMCDCNGVKIAICGVNLSDGSVCKADAVKGRKRCELHKGMRITAV